MKITKQEFLNYEYIRKLGVTNMFDTKIVQDLSGLPKEKIIEIMKNYSQLKEGFNL